jgi:hypothetical protein
VMETEVAKSDATVLEHLAGRKHSDTNRHSINLDSSLKESILAMYILLI